MWEISLNKYLSFSHSQFKWILSVTLIFHNHFINGHFISLKTKYWVIHVQCEIFYIISTWELPIEIQLD